jgi:hypothetical protein
VEELLAPGGALREMIDISNADAAQQTTKLMESLDRSLASFDKLVNFIVSEKA